MSTGLHLAGLLGPVIDLAGRRYSPWPNGNIGSAGDEKLNHYPYSQKRASMSRCRMAGRIYRARRYDIG